MGLFTMSGTTRVTTILGLLVNLLQVHSFDVGVLEIVEDPEYVLTIRSVLNDSFSKKWPYN